MYVVDSLSLGWQAAPRAVSPGDATRGRGFAPQSLILLSCDRKVREASMRSGFTQHVSSDLGRNGRGAAKPAQ